MLSCSCAAAFSCAACSGPTTTAPASFTTRIRPAPCTTRSLKPTTTFCMPFTRTDSNCGPSVSATVNEKPAPRSYCTGAPFTVHTSVRSYRYV